MGFSFANIVTHTGQVFGPCSSVGPTPTQPACAALGSQFLMSMSAPTPPPFTGPSSGGGPITTTVDGTFFLMLHAGVFFLNPPGNPPSFGFPGESTGPASVTFALQPLAPLSNQWIFSSGEAHFVTPEPATLLLFGTTAAGLGLARWYRRRAHDREHAT
jgi:hypothetical protein